MAEERLIDDDKDKKYRFRINADGEEELVIDGEGEEPAEEAELSFDHAPEFDEDYAFGVQTDYTISEGDGGERKIIEELISKARGEMEEERFSSALEYAAEAEKYAPDDGELAALRLAVLTKNLTDFSEGILSDASKAAERVKKFSSAEQKAELDEMGGNGLNSMIVALQSQVDDLFARNEEAKAERAAGFVSDNKKSLIIFFSILVPMIIFTSLAIFFSSVMFSDTSGRFIVLTIVFGVLAAACLIALLFASRRLSTTARRVRMNKDNTRTQLGRDYIAANARLKSLRTIYDAISK